MRRFSFLLLLGFVAGVGVLSGCSDSADQAYIADTDEWYHERISRLQAETGWLSLVGLHQLGPGENNVGSAAGNDVVLTEAAPARLGSITMVGDKATFKAAPGVVVQAWQDGAASTQAFPDGALATDASGAPDVLSSGSLVFHVIQRGEKFFLRVKDRESEVLRNFRGIPRYAVDSKWRIEAQLEGEPGTVRVVNVLGQSAAEPSPGILVFKIKGETYRLQPTGRPGERLFVVFGDATNGHGSYPGGRFLVTEPASEDGRVILDFNRAYNPPCAFTEYATCPLPGPDNTLLVEITAGEKAWGTGH